MLARDEKEAVACVNDLAPEHLHIATDNAEELGERIDNAGAIFLGHYTPVAVGDYAAGPSHVLPTGGTARFTSGLSANDFLRRSSVLSFTREGLAAMADDVIRVGPARRADRPRRQCRGTSREMSTPQRHRDTEKSKIRMIHSFSVVSVPLWLTRVFWRPALIDSLRPCIRAMAGYTPGEQPRDGAFIKLNTNENPYPPSPRVFEALRDALTGDRLRKYPDPVGDCIFAGRQGRVLGIDPDGILIGNGSDDILTILTRAFVPEGGLIVSPTPSYLLYRTLANLQGARFRPCRSRADWKLPDRGRSSTPI